MTATDYWMADAEYLSVHDDMHWLIGEDENAEWWVPLLHKFGWVRFKRWNLRHWLCYLNSRRRNQVVFLFG